MAQIQIPVAYQVDVIEYERGWGQRLVETLYFDNELEAKNHCNKINSRNTDDVAPDWYMMAYYKGKV
jgi:hypothetical protein